MHTPYGPPWRGWYPVSAGMPMWPAAYEQPGAAQPPPDPFETLRNVTTLVQEMAGWLERAIASTLDSKQVTLEVPLLTWTDFLGSTATLLEDLARMQPTGHPPVLRRLLGDAGNVMHRLTLLAEIVGGDSNVARVDVVTAHLFLTSLIGLSALLNNAVSVILGGGCSQR